MKFLAAAILLSSALANFLLARWWARLILNTYEKASSHFPAEIIIPPTESPPVASLALGIRIAALGQAIGGIIALILALR